MNKEMKLFIFLGSTCCGIFLLDGITRGVFIVSGKEYIRGYMVLMLHFFFLKVINQIFIEIITCILLV